MSERIFLTPEELFFLGEILHAKYIDYDYVKLMKDVQKNYKLLKHKSMQSLMDKNLICEDFSGNVEIDWEFEQLLKAIFFTQKEVEIVLFDKADNLQKKKIHKLDKLLVDVVIENNGLYIYKTEIRDIYEYLYNLFELYNKEKDAINKKEILKSDIKESLIIRYLHVGKMAINYQYIKNGNAWYKGENGDLLVPVKIDDLNKIVDWIGENK